MRKISIYRFAVAPACWLKNGDSVSFLSPFRIITMALLLCIMSGCEKEPDISERKAILTSYVWDNTESCGTTSTETGLYTCIYKPNGMYQTYYKAYVTFSGSWRLVDWE